MCLSMNLIIEIVTNNAKVHLQVCQSMSPMVFPLSRYLMDLLRQQMRQGLEIQHRFIQCDTVFHTGWLST